MRSGVIAVLLTWAGAVAFGALPFVFAEQPLSLTDAVFESGVGLTATGSTLHVGLDQTPRGILLWRFLLSWMGGFGLVTFAVLILPSLRVGGVQLFTVDLSARPGKFLPRTAEVVGQIARIYILLTLACTIAYAAAGMSTFDAVGHAMATVATAGVSSHDAGLGYFQSPAIEWIATLFMLLSAMPFVLYIYLLRGQVAPLLRDSQVRLFAVDHPGRGGAARALAARRRRDLHRAGVPRGRLQCRVDHQHDGLRQPRLPLCGAASPPCCCSAPC